MEGVEKSTLFFFVLSISYLDMIISLFSVLAFSYLDINFILYLDMTHHRSG